MSDSTDLRPLLADYTSGEISAEQLQALETLLRKDSDLRREYIEHMNIDSALGDLAALSEAEVAEIEAIGSESRQGFRQTGEPRRLASFDKEAAVRVSGPRRNLQLAVVGTVAATLLFAAILWFANPGDDENAPVATVMTDIEAILLCGGEPCRNAELRPGEYQLDRGLLHLQFRGGVMVYVEAPARFDALSDKRVVLHSGRLSASVPPEGVGFAVETPEAEVLDYGTEFSMEVESGASEVHVFDGKVRVQPRSRKEGMTETVDLRTSQAVRIEAATGQPKDIPLAKNRFIRNFDEPKWNYHRTVRQLAPVACYRMPIRAKGLHCEPRRYSGEVLTGDGLRPPHAPGYIGGSLRVQAESTGRGARVDTPPPLDTGTFTVVALVYADSLSAGGTVTTNLHEAAGNFALMLGENGLLRATGRADDGRLKSCSGGSALPLKTWRHVAVTADGQRLRLFEDGKLVGSTECAALAPASGAPLFLGAGVEGKELWDGRIDEVAFYDRALTTDDIAIVYKAARQQSSESP